ncbi:unnamed protein product [Blepharisma stoltei]|uniref:Integrase catalytic domain-containing protein n=1 Tax=Blepharisma stoltei TaxID=1481888 RepID=A0AAU9IL58_9CILI|nr:unnamed protein product [Blepharisma stoltei]
MKEEFFDVARGQKIYNSIDLLQNDLDEWLLHYNYERPHSGKYCYGKSPTQTFEDSKKLALEKNNEIYTLNISLNKIVRILAIILLVRLCCI